MANNVTPYQNDKSKKEQVTEMFDNISENYDFLNHSLSFGIDVLWRKKTVKHVKKQKPSAILDVATGTADLAIALTSTGAKKIVGVDLSQGMLNVGIEKVKKRQLDQIITLQKADSEHLPFENNTFDTVTISFGIRNVENPLKGLQEMHRVLNANGKVYVLEFSMPTAFPFKQLYKFYFKNILPLWGRIISKDNSAYTYLPESVQAFPYGLAFVNLLKEAGFKNAIHKPLSLGIATLYIAEK